MKLPILTVVVPCYNEEEVFQKTYRELKNILIKLIDENLIHVNSRILFIDDGSKDSTWNHIEEAYRKDLYVDGLKLSRNFGHQEALLAGLEEAAKHSDCVISIDADLQDDVGAIREFVLKYLEGYDIVYGVRINRSVDTFFKRKTAELFYKGMEKLGLPLIFNHADYRLMSKKALEVLLQYKETHLFLRGIIPLLGFKSIKVYYDRKERAAGVSKYPLRKMLGLAMDGVTSFSIRPIRFITIIGFITFIVSILASIYVFIQKMSADPVSGWASIMISLWFIGGLVLMSLGLIGEYIGKIYEEVKMRPRYTVEERLHHFHPRERLLKRRVKQ